MQDMQDRQMQHKGVHNQDADASHDDHMRINPLSKVSRTGILSWGVGQEGRSWGEVGEGGADRRVPSSVADVLRQHSSCCSHLSMQQPEDWQHIAPKNCLHLRVPQQWPSFCNALGSLTA